MSNYLAQQFFRTRFMLEKHVEGLTEEVSNVTPEGLNNNIKWQIGHILLTADSFVLKHNPVAPAHYANYFAANTKPADWDGTEPLLEEILQYIKEQAQKMQDLDAINYDEPLPRRIVGSETVGELIALATFHEAYHVGQVNIIRKLVEHSAAMTYKEA